MNKITKIVFIGGNLSINKGGAALIISSYESIKMAIPNAEFIVTSHFIGSDVLMSEQYPEIEIVPELKINFPLSSVTSWAYYLFLSVKWNFLKLLNLNKSRVIKEKIIKTYQEADLIIEISGDGLSGDYGFYATLISLSRLWVGILLKKKIFVYAQSIGPFHIKWHNTETHSEILSYICKKYAKFILNRVDMITIREKISEELLKKIKVTKTPIYLTADSAFLLNPISKGDTINLLSRYGLNEKQEIVGISLSNSIGKLQYDNSNNESMNIINYKQIMLEVIEYLTSKFKLNVLMIPHVTGPGAANDDRIIAFEIYEKLTNKKNVFNVSDELTAKELKGLIGNCKLFIGSRMHANIAAISMGVPTLAIGYSHKTTGIMEMAGQKEFILNFQQLNFDVIVEKLDILWKGKESISIQLKQNVSSIKNKALCNVDLVKKLLE